MITVTNPIAAAAKQRFTCSPFLNSEGKPSACFVGSKEGAWLGADQTLLYIKTLEDALQFYADLHNWKWKTKEIGLPFMLHHGTEVQFDFGERARNALAGGKVGA